MFRYCPSCASQTIRFEQDKVFRCPACGFTYYHNTAAATACFINTRRGILFQVRNRDPARGRLDLPGGFVDPGEGIFEGLRRELFEELGWPRRDTPGLQIRLFASFPNRYPYKGIIYNTCDLFFVLDAPELTGADLKLEEAEIAGVRFVQPEDLDPEELAFDSVRRALPAYLEFIHRQV
ncbi:MAG: NUDIX domain-containing protein [Treponema sp.]|jgi:8-oxo-dGTP pyrophosphatase MutT (NUDIX family)|nr:NUDIX domain-containing protein [Treponema sp.]